MNMLTRVGVTSPKAWWQEAYAAAQDRGSWRTMVKGLVVPMPFTGWCEPPHTELPRPGGETQEEEICVLSLCLFPGSVGGGLLAGLTLP